MSSVRGVNPRTAATSDWDFGCQDIYRLAQPIPLPAGSTLHMRFSFDNSATNPGNPSSPPRRVSAGNRSFDEMAHLQLQVERAAAEDINLSGFGVDCYSTSRISDEE